LSSVSLFLVVAVLLVGTAGALLARLLPARASKPPPAQAGSPPSRRNAALQGFRGLLAFGVFMHHAFLWNRYGRGHAWYDANVWHQFGESRVVLFFMLTATLFYGRLLDARGSRIDWLKLYVTRLLRLGPAYWFAMLLMFAAVARTTALHLNGAGTSPFEYSWGDIIGQCAAWLGFSMLGMPSIDGYYATPVITACVTWTLPYECVFYLLLPLLALPLRVRIPATALAIGLAAAVWLAMWQPEPMYCTPFACGFAVAMLMRVPRAVALLRHRACAVGAVIATTVAILGFPSMLTTAPMLLLFFTMAVVASGNDLFGILSWRVPQMLGNCAYSLYLLHGIVLYTLFMLVIGVERGSHLTDWQYAGIIVAVTPVVLALSWASQRWIESPPMRAVPAVVAAIRRFVPQRPPAQAPLPAAIAVVPSARAVEPPTA
jgi:peptidoglycan/LPS O-acetylase OafA/YrhL